MLEKPDRQTVTLSLGCYSLMKLVKGHTSTHPQSFWSLETSKSPNGRRRIGTGTLSACNWNTSESDLGAYGGGYDEATWSGAWVSRKLTKINLRMNEVLKMSDLCDRKNGLTSSAIAEEVGCLVSGCENLCVVPAQPQHHLHHHAHPSLLLLLTNILPFIISSQPIFSWHLTSPHCSTPNGTSQCCFRQTAFDPQQEQAHSSSQPLRAQRRRTVDWFRNG